ncbi:endonuclease/exonuclease/phosphatase family protein [Pengzhenrongella phosphoraccumulans]|uniref:endonuclease/exonuclease/phosphatase family protein n=1 Tax=Pengzhenrongella phosphoraccumulans TaxID=3114394 RepID=UPI0038904421
MSPPFPPAPPVPPAAPDEPVPRWLAPALRPSPPFAQYRAHLTQVALLAVLTALTLDLVRASGPLLDRAFTAGVLAAAGTALLTYALPGALLGVLLVLTGAARRPDAAVRRALPAGVIALAVARLALQGAGGDARFVGGLVIVALAIAVLVLAVAALASQADGGALTAAGVAIGTGLSLALQTLLHTWDPVWRGDLSGWAVVSVLTLAAVALAVTVARSAAPPEPVRPGRLWALGPYLALAAMMLANLSFLASQTTRELPIAGALWWIPVLFGSLAVRFLPRMPDVVLRWSWTCAVALPPAVAGTLWFTGVASSLALIVAIATAPVVLATALRCRPAPAPAPLSTRRLAVAASATGLGVILPLLGYQVDYDVPLGFPNALVIVATAVVLALAGWIGRPRATADALSPARLSAITLVAALVVLPLAVPALLAPPAPTTEARAPTSSLRLLDWNLHYGVSGEPGVELEEIAQVIEGSGADIVTLQEVSRGWVMGGGAEMATWLADRLGMQVVFAPAADRQFGNAILSRFTLSDVDRHPLPYGAGPQRRSAISATVHLADGAPVRVTSVHLQHRASNTPTRLDQLGVLLAAEPAQGSAVVAGDLNATPGSPEVDLVTGAGYRSAIDAAGEPAALTSPSADPVERIDWVFGHGVRFSDVAVLEVPWSDHLPVVATLTATATR